MSRCFGFTSTTSIYEQQKLLPLPTLIYSAWFATRFAHMDQLAPTVRSGRGYVRRDYGCFGWDLMTQVHTFRMMFSCLIISPYVTAEHDPSFDARHVKPRRVVRPHQTHLQGGVAVEIDIFSQPFERIPQPNIRTTHTTGYTRRIPPSCPRQRSACPY